MRNILFISSNISNSGGTERIGIGLANALVGAGHSVKILSLFGENKPFFQTSNQIKILTLKRKHVNLAVIYPWVVLKVRSIIKSEKIDIVIDICVLISLVSILAKWKTGAKNISWEHFNFSIALHNKKELFARKLASRFSNGVVTLTKTDAEMYQSNLQCSAVIECIPNFLTYAIKEPSKLSHRVALAIGRLTYQKGFDLLLKIWKGVFEHNKEWHLKIIGDGEEYERLNELIKYYRIESVVEIISTTKEIDFYYKTASLLLVSSRWEGLPMVMIEAQSYGLPIVSFDCLTGPKDIINHTQNGYLIKNGDLNAFKDTLLDLLQNTKKLAEMGKNALIDSKRFEKNILLKKWVDLINGI